MKKKNKILDCKIRQDIYRYILKNPGLHFRELERKLNIPKSTLDYHINFLRKNNFISIKNDGNLKRFYIFGKVGTKDKKLLGLLRQDVPFKIIINLLVPGHCSETELSNDIKRAYSTISFHIDKLLTKEIIKPAERKEERFIASNKHNPFVPSKKQGRKEIFYTFKNYEITEDIHRLLMTYKKSMTNPNIIDAYNYFIKESNKVIESNKEIKNIDFNSTIDNFVHILKEIFPFPYHF
jgi:DNA-binding MarR family transcriptional regulator